MKKVIVIVGPTGSGKTTLSIKLAKILNAEIINGDSVQIYQGLDIGSAKIKKDEMDGIKHHLFDVKEAGSSYSVFDFQKDVRQLISQIDVPMIVGGTGLYIKAALYQYEFIEKGRSEEFEEKIKDLSNEVLYGLLKDKDPDIVIDHQNRRRLTRAYEQALAGELRSSKKKKDEPLYDALFIFLDVERSILEEKLKLRLEKQIQEGFIEEVEKLLSKDIHINAIGYRELEQYINKEISLEEAKEAIIKVSKKLAKKQKTWFKNQMNPVILDAASETLFEEALKECQSFLAKEEQS